MSQLLDLAPGLGSLSGDTLWEIFFNYPQRAEEIARKIETRIIDNGGWSVKDDISDKPVIGEKGKIRVRTPKKQLADECEFYIDAMTYELLINTTQGLQRTGRIIKTINVKVS